MRPEQPARVLGSASHLRASHPEWHWEVPPPARVETVLKAHTQALFDRIAQPADIDEDTPYFKDIREHALRAAGAALEAVSLAEKGIKSFSLMRPPGHHATRSQAMGFCYLNSIAIAAREAAYGSRRVAVWDFDAHHGNGTEDILRNQPNLFFASVHQYPGYPGTGHASGGNIANYPVPPHSPRARHCGELARSWEAVQLFQPDLILVSAGFDAYARDPITSMTLEVEDFAELGRWLRQCDCPVAAVLEGGYSVDLPVLIDAFLSTWENEP